MGGGVGVGGGTFRWSRSKATNRGATESVSTCLFGFLAIQNSSIGDLVNHSLSHSVTVLLLLTNKEQPQRLATFETSDQRDDLTNILTMFHNFLQFLTIWILFLTICNNFCQLSTTIDTFDNFCLFLLFFDKFYYFDNVDNFGHFFLAMLNFLGQILIILKSYYFCLKYWLLLTIVDIFGDKFYNFS